MKSDPVPLNANDTSLFPMWQYTIPLIPFSTSYCIPEKYKYNTGDCCMYVCMDHTHLITF